MSKLYQTSLALCAALVLAGSVHAQTSTHELTVGEVRKIDKENGKLTLKHGPLKNLDMPGMTMVFRVGDAAMLDRVKAGDKVRFAADSVDGKLTVTHMEAAPASR